MRKLINQIKNMHPSAVAAAVGGILFCVGSIWVFADTVSYALMWIGGILVFSAAMAASVD